MGSKSIKVNAILNMLKQLCAVVFPLITIPYVSRVLQVTSYGKYNFSSSIVSYFSLLAGLGIANYAIREGARVRNDRDKIEKFSSEVYTINIYSTIVSYAILVTLLLFSVKLQNYTLLIVVQSLAIVLTTIGADWVNSIYEDYVYITIRYLIMQLLALIAMFLFVKQPEDYIIYAFITVFASAGGNLFNLVYIRKYVHLKLVRHCNLKTHMRPIVLLFFNAIAVTIYVNSDITILGLIQSEEAVGIYGLPTKIYIVVKMVLNSIIIVSLSRLSAYLGKGEVKEYQRLANKILNVLCTLIFPAVVGLFILSKEVILIVGGAEYADGYNALRILSISLGFAVLAGFYCCCVLLPYKQEKILLIASIISGVTNISLNFVAIRIWSYNGAALTTMLSEAIVFVIYVIVCRKYPKISFTGKTLIPIFVGCLSIIAICILFKGIFENVLIQVIVSIACSGITYFMIQIALKNELVMQMLRIVLKKFKLADK
jgi:O-antigen/teichoic acid export membrane protein